MANDPTAHFDVVPAVVPSIGLWREVTGFLHQFVIAAFDPYRPEQHYMRGPGPAWRAKHGAASRREPPSPAGVA
jgi:hypothetical protein